MQRLALSNYETFLLEVLHEEKFGIKKEVIVGSIYIFPNKSLNDFLIKLNSISHKIAMKNKSCKWKYK